MRVMLARRPRWPLVVTATITLLLVIVLAACGQREAKDPLRVGYQNSPAMALVMIAEEKAYFDANNVNVELVEFTAGKFALQAFIGGSLDSAIAGDMPIGLALLQGQDVVGIAEVLANSHSEMRMIVRSPTGCAGIEPSTYFSAKRRKIATSFGGGPQYFTVRFLQAHNVPLDQVELVSQKPEEMPAALNRGAVDGVAIFDPAAAEAERLLGPAHCTFPDPENYRQHYVMVAKSNSLASPKAEQYRRFIAALRDADRFANEHPQEAQQIVASKTGLPPAVIATIWPRYDFGVVLDDSLRNLWMQQAEWHRSQPGTAVLATPNYETALNRSFIDR